MVASHTVCYDCRCDQHYLHQSTLGHQNSFHGACCSLARQRLFYHEYGFGQTQSPCETRYRHTLDAAITIYRSEGIRAFYRGLLPSLLGITHVAVQFPLYEKLKIVARTFSSISTPPCEKTDQTNSHRTSQS